MQRLDGGLRKQFAERRGQNPFDSVPFIRAQGLVLGHGTVLMRLGYNRRGERLLALTADEDRLIALLSAASGREISRDVMRQVARASDCLRRDDKVQAQIELAFAHLPRLETQDDAFRLFLAEDLLAKGFTPRRLLRALGLDERLRKYDPQEPRDWEGRWTREGGAAAPVGDGKKEDQKIADDKKKDDSSLSFLLAGAAPTTGFLEGATPAALRALSAFIARLSVPIAIAGALLIPSRNSSVRDGEVPSLEGVHYHYAGPSRTTIFTMDLDDGRKVSVVGERFPDGLCRDPKGRVLGRYLADGLYFDRDALVAAFWEQIDPQRLDNDVSDRSDVRNGIGPHSDLVTRPDEPKLCPDPSQDRGKPKIDATKERDPRGEREFADLYQEYIGYKINGFILPAELAYALQRPGGLLPVMFDHCRLSNGDMIDAKGHYANALKYAFIAEKIREELIAQAERQIAAADANGGRRLEWHFAEKETMEKTIEWFNKVDKKLLKRIAFVYTEYPGTKEWPYPERAQRTWAKGRQKE